MKGADRWTPRMREAIRRWEGETWESIAEFHRAVGVTAAGLRTWRMYGPFKKRFEERRLEMIQSTGALRAKPIKEPLPPPGIEAKFDEFLKAYRENPNRVEAAEAAGLDWETEIEPALKANKEFRDGYDRLRRYQEMKIEDALRSKAADGDTAALNTLVRQNLLRPTPASGTNGGSPGMPDVDLKKHYRERLKIIGAQHAN